MINYNRSDASKTYKTCFKREAGEAITRSIHLPASKSATATDIQMKWLRKGNQTEKLP